MKRLLFILILICIVPYLKGQDSTHVILARDVIQKRPFIERAYGYLSGVNSNNHKGLNINTLLFPHYSTDTKLGIAIAAIGTYSIDKKDTLLAPSSISLIGDITTTGYYLLGVRGNNFFMSNRLLLDYSLIFSSFPSNFWGLGFSNANNSKNKSSYLKEQVSFKNTLRYKLNSKHSVGVVTGYDFISAANFSKDSLAIGLDGMSNSYSYGALYIYDKRDYAINATNGVYFKIQQRNFITANNKPFFKTDLQFNSYQPLWEGATLALDLFCEFGYGTTPWQMMSNLGGIYRMRGYYLGRYRDNNISTIQVEYRQRVYNRHRAVVWGGVGNVWGVEQFSLSHTLPNYGIGYRFELNNRLSFRVDYGFGSMGQNSLIIGINEAF